jgi:hypothetical protein
MIMPCDPFVGMNSKPGLAKFTHTQSLMCKALA